MSGASIREHEAWHPFCVLEHTEGGRFTRETGSAGVHWDWMFAVDSNGTLRTWSGAAASLDELFGKSSSSVPYELCCLPDHRRRYLEYEGPISGDRGSVRRILAGRYRCIAFDGCETTLLVHAEIANQPVGLKIRLSTDSNADYGSTVSGGSLPRGAVDSKWTLVIAVSNSDASNSDAPNSGMSNSDVSKPASDAM